MESSSLTPIKEEVSYCELVEYMNEFGVDYLNSNQELIIDEKTNTYTYIGKCNNMEDIETCVIYSLCRPIGKGLIEKDAIRLLKRVNRYYEQNLTREDMLSIYIELCYINKFEELKSFIQRGFPMEELKSEN